ncbi:MAG: ribonucleoside triphosphate reductase, partial [Candidatus Diapherotrites archaeon]|nr:ribonucleoside triphosphate reductase [Candidatus Diapherotrites archaeon]
MIKFIMKRDGKIVPFNKGKIEAAIWKAARAVGGKDRKRAAELSTKVVKFLEKQLKPGEIPTVEQVQDAVEKVLIEEGHAKTAKAYILYRKQREEARDITKLLKTIDIVDNYLQMKDWRVKENANMTFSLQGLNTHVASIVISEYWLNKIYPPEIRKAHKEAVFHIHDLSTLGAYCVGWDLFDLLLVGFTGVRGKISSRPAKHFRTALGQVVNFFYTLQGEAAGAQALSNFDTLLAPFIHYDGLNERQVKQALQEFMFNMNVPTRVGFQTPFTNITLDLVPPEHLANQPVIIGGEPQNTSYAEFQEEMDLFNKLLAEVMSEGDAQGRVFTFPIPTYNITKDFDWDNEVLSSIWQMTAKYGIPYFANFVNSDMKPEDARSMCCRLRLDTRELKRRGGGLFGANPLTGSIGVVTINLPHLAYLSKDEKDFFDSLGDYMELAKNSLEIKRKTIERLTEQGLYPYSKFYLRAIKQSTGHYWENHFSTIGLIGANEAALNLFGFDLTTKEGIRFANKILDYMRERIAEFQEETGHIYNLEATPAEGASHRLAMIDKKNFKKIIVANENDVREKGAAPY